MSICIIPARGGSIRIPRKNIKDFCGQPIILYSIQNAIKAGFDRVVVSTDDDEIAKVSADAGAEIHWRSPELCENEVGTQEVVKHVLLGLDIMPGEAVCCLYPCTPLLNANELKCGMDLLSEAATYVWAGIALSNCVKDAGQFYIGIAGKWYRDIPLSQEGSLVMLLGERAIDINTEADWQAAEALYESRK